jgi:hypothetical protein
VIEIRLEWIRHNIYQLQELKEVINCCITKSDGATQLADVGAIKTLISEANSFSELYKTLNKYLSN